MNDVYLDIPNDLSKTYVKVGQKLHLNFTKNVTFCNTNPDAFWPYMPNNIYFVSGSCWIGVAVKDYDGKDDTYCWTLDRSPCERCLQLVGHIIHIG